MLFAEERTNILESILANFYSNYVKSDKKQRNLKKESFLGRDSFDKWDWNVSKEWKFG